MPSAVEAWNLSHWITREVPTSFLRYSSQNLTVFLLMRFGYGPSRLPYAHSRVLQWQSLCHSGSRGMDVVLWMELLM